jgi:transcription elongation factor Elf1
MSQRIIAPWVDDKYTLMLSHTLERFSVVNQSPLKVVFRCPFCGDSRKSKTKTRAALFSTQDGTMFKCQNCDHSTNLRGVLKRVDQRMYGEYVAELFLKKNGDRVATVKELRKQTLRETAPIQPPTLEVPGLQKLSSLPADHPARAYWASRRLPTWAMDDAYWCAAYYKWVNDKVMHQKFGSRALNDDHGRIVFPFRNASRKIIGYTGRTIDGSEPKYAAVKVDPDPSPFGAHRVDASRTVYVVEGPIDSLFLKNAVAMGTASRDVPYDDRVLVFDNEPRNEQIVAIVRRAIDRGERVVVWPPNFPHKDINDIVMAGLDPAEIIRNRTFSGLRAKIEFGAWLNH